MQAQLGAKKAVAFDLTAACSGFVLALVTAVQYVRAGTFKRVLVVGGDALSRFVDWRDRGEHRCWGAVCRGRGGRGEREGGTGAQLVLLAAGSPLQTLCRGGSAAVVLLAAWAVTGGRGGQVGRSGGAGRVRLLGWWPERGPMPLAAHGGSLQTL